MAGPLPRPAPGMQASLRTFLACDASIAAGTDEASAQAAAARTIAAYTATDS